MGLAAVGFLISVWLRLRAEQKRLAFLEERFAVHVRFLGGAALAARLSSMFSHELRQPIAAILLNAQGALRMLQKADICHAGLNESLLDIVKDDSRLDGLLQHWRALLIQESSEVQTLEVGAELDGIMKLLGGEWVRHGLQAELQVSPGLPSVCWSRAGFTQLMVALLLAALDSMKEQSKKTPILLVHADRVGADAIVISIQDNGNRTVDQVTASLSLLSDMGAPDDLGMGLFAVAGNVRSRGGTIVASSIKDGGIKVTCTLPVQSLTLT
jgi:C4-dicarboxylate-specific signal transduction histidine kinase